MKHSEAQAALARLSKNLYDGSAEKMALAAAARALAFVHGLACHNGAVSIPAQTMLGKLSIVIEPETVIEPPLKEWRGGPDVAAVD